MNFRRLAVVCVLSWSALPASSARGEPPRASAPPPAEAPPFAPNHVHAFRLGNGVQVYAYPEQDERVAVTVSFDLSDLVRERRAIHVLTGALINSGTAHLTTSDFRERKLNADATIDSASFMDQLRVSVVCPAPQLNASLELLHAVILDSALTESAVSYARTGRAAWLETLLATDPTRQALFREEVLLWGPSSPYGMEFLDTAADTRAVTTEQVQKVFALLLDPKRVVVAVAGKYDDAALPSLIEGAFGTMAAPSVRSPSTAPPAGRAPGRVALMDRSGAVTARIRVGASSPPINETDNLALLLLTQIVGSSDNGRLEARLHGELHLTDKVGSELFTGRAGDAFMMTAEVPIASAGQAVQEIERLAKALVDQDVDPGELRAAKDRLVAEDAGSFERVKDVASGMLTLHSSGLDPEARYQTYVKKLAAIGPGDLRRVARRFLTPSAWKVVVVGDAATLRPALTRVGYLPDTQ